MAWKIWGSKKKDTPTPAQQKEAAAAANPVGSQARADLKRRQEEAELANQMAIQKASRDDLERRQKQRDEAAKTAQYQAPKDLDTRRRAGGTLLTGPLGLMGAATTRRKTLLGG
jgi:hypothetical protein